MLLTVKKQVEETVEVKTPAYYKDFLGNYYHINEAGELISVRQGSLTSWLPEDGKYHTEAIVAVLKDGVSCTKEEFDKAYIAVMDRLESAVGVIKGDY